MDSWTPDKLHYAQVKCSGCGLLISQPQCTREEAAEYYSGPYYSEVWPDPGTTWQINSREYRRYELPALQELWRGWLKPGARIIEAGCGYGAMLDVLRANAYRPFGFDVSVGALRFPKGEKLRVAAGEAEHIPVQDGCFDAAISLHVIEHLLDPREFVNTLSRTVRPGGVIAIVTEDAHIAQYSWERFRRRLAGAVPRFRSSYDHTFVFRAKHLEKLLREAGCSEVRTTALTRRIEGESLHWRAYKGLFRWLDRLMGHGEILIAVGRLSP